MGTPMLDGREFTALDRAESAPVMIVNRAFVNRLGLGDRIIGRQASDWRGAKQHTIDRDLIFRRLRILAGFIGAYGVAAFAVTERRHEIGVRIAVGAKIAQIRLLLLRQSLLPLTLGLAAGVAGAFTVENSLRALMYDAPALDPMTCAGAAFLLSIGASAAVWSATRSILKMDPISALRVD